MLRQKVEETPLFETKGGGDATFLEKTHLRRVSIARLRERASSGAKPVGREVLGGKKRKRKKERKSPRGEQVRDIGRLGGGGGKKKRKKSPRGEQVRDIGRLGVCVCDIWEKDGVV